MDCHKVLTPLDINFSFPDNIQELLDEIEKRLEGVEDFVNNVVGFLKGIIDNIGDETNYVKCYSGTGKTLNAIVEGIGETFKLATCWVDPLVEDTSDEVLDILLRPVQSLVDATR